MRILEGRSLKSGRSPRALCVENFDKNVVAEIPHPLSSVAKTLNRHSAFRNPPEICIWRKLFSR